MIVDWNTVIETSFDQIGYTDDHLKPLDIRFGTGTNQTYGRGVRNQWFHRLGCDLVKSMGHISDTAVEQRAFHLLQSERTKKDEKYYTFFGKVVGLALLNHALLGVSIGKMLFLYLGDQHQVITLDDVQDYDPYYHDTLSSLLEMPEEEYLDVRRTCVVDVDPSYFSWTYIDPQDDQDVDGAYLDDVSRAEFVDSIIQHQYFVSLEKELIAFRGGLDQVIGSTYRRIFFRLLNLSELHGMLRGTVNLSVQEWRQHTTYHNYQEGEEVVSWFWQCVTEMTAEDRLSLFRCWTGLPALPYGGFNVISFVICKVDNPLHMPSVHTCCSQIDIPQYVSLEKMRECLKCLIADPDAFGLP